MRINVECKPMVTTKHNMVITVLQHMYNIGAVIMRGYRFHRDGVHCITPWYLLLSGLEVVQLQHPPNVVDRNDGCVMCSSPKVCSGTTNTKSTKETKLRSGKGARGNTSGQQA